MAGYQKNTWVIYNKDIPNYDQPNSFITKRKLDHMEEGIQNAVTDFTIGTVTKGTNIGGEIIADENDPSVRKINLVLPKEVSWLFSNIELHNSDIAPVGASINDIVIDSKGNIFTIVEAGNGVNVLKFKMNIKGATGDQGIPGPQGEPGEEYHLEIGEVIITDKVESVSAEIVDHKLNLVIPVIKGNPGEPGEPGKPGVPGEPGESTYDIWKSLGNTGDAADFIESIKGKVAVVDSLDSTSTTEALSANKGRELKNNRLTTLDEILANEEEGIFVDALAVKELYFKLLEVINIEFKK